MFESGKGAERDGVDRCGRRIRNPQTRTMGILNAIYTISPSDPIPGPKKPSLDVKLKDLLSEEDRRILWKRDIVTKLEELQA